MLLELRNAIHKPRTLSFRRDGIEVAAGGMPFMQEAANLHIEGRPWAFGKDNGTHVATTPAYPDLTLYAKPRHYFSGTWVVSVPTGEYELKQRSFVNDYEVHYEGAQIGVSGLSGVKGSLSQMNYSLALGPDLVNPEAVFMLWIAFLMRLRAAARRNAVVG